MDTNDAKIRDRMHAMWAKSFADKIRARATSLRTLADALDRSADDVAKVTAGTTTSVHSSAYAHTASNVQHEVLWALANLNLDNLTVDAYDLDRLRLDPPA